MSDSDEYRTTTDRTLIRSMMEDHGAYPAHRAGSEGSGDHGLLRIGYKDRDESELTKLSWDEFFEEFDRKNLEFVYADEPSGAEDPFELRERDGK